MEYTILWRGRVVSVGQPEQWLRDSVRLVCALEGSKEREAANRGVTPGIEPQPLKYKPKIAPAKLKRVQIPSNTHEGVFYTIVCHRTTGEVMSCSCPSFFYRKRCTHKDAYEDSNKKGAQ